MFSVLFVKCCEIVKTVSDKKKILGKLFCANEIVPENS